PLDLERGEGGPAVGARVAPRLDEAGRAEVHSAVPASDAQEAMVGTEHAGPGGHDERAVEVAEGGGELVERVVAVGEPVACGGGHVDSSNTSGCSAIHSACWVATWRCTFVKWRRQPATGHTPFATRLR